MVEIKKIEDEIIGKLTLYIFKESQKNLVQDGKVDTGNLLRDVDLGKDFIHYKAPYADIIEVGRRPGAINPDVLEGWVRRKLGIKDPRENKKVREAIAKKIRQRGFEGNFYMQRAIDNAEKLFKDSN